MYLKQSTAYTFRHGPFLDETDGKTAETGLTISQADVRLSKAGGNFAQKNESTSASHDEIGFYIVLLDATDTATCGELLVAVHESGALPVFKTFQVVEEAIYDALFAASANLITKVDAIDTVVDAVLVDTGTTIPATIATVDTVVDAILVDTGTTIPATIATVDTVVDAILVDTGTTLNDKIDVVDGIVDNILVDTAVIGAAGAGLTDLGGMSTGMKAEVNVECDGSMVTYGLDHLVSASVAGGDITDNSIVAKLVSKESTADWDDFVNTTDSLQAMRDRGDAAWTTGAGGTPPQLMQSTTIASLASQTSFTLTAGSADDDAYNSCVIIITDQSTGVQKAHGSISDYTGSSKTVTLSADPGIFTVATGDTVDIMSPLGAAGSGPSAATVADAVWDEATSGHTTSGTFGEQLKTDVDAILADTNELQSDDIPGSLSTISGKIDTVDNLVDTEVAAIKTVVDTILVDTNELQTDWVNGGRLDLLLDSVITKIDAVDDFLDTEVAAILADTNELQVDWTNGGRLDLLIDSIISKVDVVDGIVDNILVDTGTTLDGKLDTIDNFIDTEVASIVSKVDVIDGIVDSILVDTAEIGAAGAGLTAIGNPSTLQITTIASLASQVSFTLTAGSADNDAYNGATIVITDQSTSTQKAVATVSDYVGSSRTVTLASDPGIFTMATGDTVNIIMSPLSATIGESYATDGAAATPAQLLYQIYCAVGEFSISGTTITGKKLDGSTTAMTWTLDSDTAPTSRTRAS